MAGDEHAPVGPVQLTAGRLVLLVDDYEDNLDMYVQYLTFVGYRTLEARNGVEAIEQAMTARPDLVVVDLSIPYVDGWEVTRRLKEDPRTKDTPVIVLTGHALPGVQKTVQEAGADAYLTKPCLPERLAAVVEAFLRRHEAPQP